MQDDGTAGDREIRDLARVRAVYASRRSAALRTLTRAGYPAQFDVHSVVDGEHALDARTPKVRERDTDVQGATSKESTPTVSAPSISITSP
jgi:hypothetical protein